MPATPSFDASAVRCTSWAVFEPVEPAITGIDTAADTFSQSVNFSSSLSVGASPVVPQIDEALVALGLQPARQLDGPVDVEREVVVERADHRREHTSEAGHGREPMPWDRGPSAQMARTVTGTDTAGAPDGVAIVRRRSALRTIDGRNRDVGGASRKNTFSIADSTVSSVVLAARTRSR